MWHDVVGSGIIDARDIELTSSMANDLPWNYMVKGNRVFDFVIVNPDTPSR